MINDHFRIGHKYPSVKINTSYSFGLDDQEFVVAFETDSAPDFLDLVVDLRGVERSLYTLKDTPDLHLHTPPHRRNLGQPGRMNGLRRPPRLWPFELARLC